MEANFSGLTIFEFMNQDKVTFFSARTSLTFTHYPPSPSGTCALPFDFMLGRRDSQIIFYYQCDVRIIRTRSLVVYYLINMNTSRIVVVFISCQYIYVPGFCLFYLRHFIDRIYTYFQRISFRKNWLPIGF